MAAWRLERLTSTVEMTYSRKNTIHCATGASAVTVREVRARLAPPRSAPSRQAPGKGTLDTVKGLLPLGRWQGWLSPEGPIFRLGPLRARPLLSVTPGEERASREGAAAVRALPACRDRAPAGGPRRLPGSAQGLCPTVISGVLTYRPPFEGSGEAHDSSSR